MEAANPEVVLRLGSHAEKEYFLKTAQHWSGLLVGANLLESAPGATASLVLKFAGAKYGVRYYVDPMTYAFGTYVEKGVTRSDLDWIKSDQKVKVSEAGGKSRKVIERRYKRSYRNLAQEFGGVALEAMNSDTGIAGLEPNQVKTLCEAVVHYQANRVRREFEIDPEYKDIADKIPSPAAVFAPYFYIDPDRSDDGVAMLADCAASAASALNSIPIHAVLCTDVAMLDRAEFLDATAARMKDSGVAGVWLWFSRFYEERAARQQLLHLRAFVENLREKVRVYNMHGGYFSLALSRFGLNGVSHGIGYGEQKDVIPVIGQSTPTVRYYLPDLRRRLGVPVIERVLTGIGVGTAADFYEQICGCAICRGVIQDDIKQFSAFGDLHYSTEHSRRMAQTPAAARRCRFHFLLNRLRERADIAGRSATDIAEDLREAREKWGGEPTTKGAVDHLRRWEDVLRA